MSGFAGDLLDGTSIQGADEEEPTTYEDGDGRDPQEAGSWIGPLLSLGIGRHVRFNESFKNNGYIYSISALRRV